MIQIEGTNRGKGLKFAVVVARFNDFVTERLQTGALDALKSAGVDEDDVCVIKVPGAFEIPFAAKEAAQRGSFAAIVCIGCLIRGATAHFEYISSAVSHGIVDAAASTGVPMTFGVLTTNSAEEALARAGEGASNKGYEAAAAAVALADVVAQLTRKAERRP
jgi:6,7-dimethyl-8-ribityllumazine synthase